MGTRRAVWRLVAVVLVGVAISVVGSTQAGAQGPTEAQASPYSRSDPTGETPFAKMDITSINVVHGSTIKLILRTRDPINPFTSAGFDRLSQMMWTIHTDAGNLWADVDFMVLLWESFITGDGDTPVVEVFNSTSGLAQNFVCSGTYARLDGGRKHKVSFPRSCIGNPSQFRVRAVTEWVTPSFASWVDFAPDTRPTPNITFAP